MNPLSVHKTLFPAGSVIFHEGAPRDGAYLIESGKVVISRSVEGKDKPLVTLGTGELFGETALVSDAPRSATATAIEDTDVFVIPPEVIKKRMQKLDPILDLVFRILIDRYRTSRHVDLNGKNLGNSSEEALAETIRPYADQQERIIRQLQFEDELREALERNQFHILLQPIIGAGDMKVAGFEALIRWDHPTRGVVPPYEFIELAERNGLIGDMDMWVMEQACELLPELQAAAGPGARELYISINLSAVHFSSDAVIRHVKRVLRRQEIDNHQLQLELTESALVEDPQRTEAILNNLKDIGTTIALDDFGTGYSSLNYLHRFSFDKIKIDRSFISRMLHDHKSYKIVEAIVNLAKSFRQTVTAEGVETFEEMQAVRALGVDFIQGFYFSKPLKPHDALVYLKTPQERLQQSA